MPSAERTITIRRPPDAVFDFFTDHGNDPSWRPNAVEIDPVRGASAGSRIHQVIKGPMGRGIAADFEVTASDRPTRYAFQVVAGPVHPRGEFRFSPSGDGATDVMFSLSADLTGVKRLLMSRSVQASMDSEMAGLEAAKRVLERAP